MSCQAKITSPYGGHVSGCNKDATHEVVLTTTLRDGSIKTTTKCFCTKHKSSYVKKHRYKIKHCFKQSTISDSLINLK